MSATSKLYWTVQTYTLNTNQSTTRQFTIVPTLSGRGILRWFRLSASGFNLFQSPLHSSYFIITIDGSQYTLPIAETSGRVWTIPVPFSSSLKLEFFASLLNTYGTTHQTSHLAEALVYLF